MRLIVFALCLTACARIGAPPGGPIRTVPPELLTVSPESGAVNVRSRGVVFSFDAVVNDRPGGQPIENFFVISPRDGRPRVEWHRDRVEVRPRDDFAPNTAYAVTMRPGISDLRGNAIRTAKTVVFSTGAEIPRFAVHGRVFDWMNERAAPNAFVEVIRQPDSLPYIGFADSIGQFAIGPLGEGRYSVRAIVDANNNRGLDPGETWDSLSVVVRGTTPFVELLTAPRDSAGPRLLGVDMRDTTTLMATFDKPLLPSDSLTPALFRIVTGDSATVRVIRVAARSDADSARVRPADTTLVAPPKPSKPAPVKVLLIHVDPLTPIRRGGTYRVTAIDARGLTGVARTSDRIVTIPLAAPPVNRPLPPS